MMTDYIKRTDAVKIAEKYGLANGSVLGRHTGLADCIARDISDLPAAEVAEVVHGRWIPTEYPFMNECEDCSSCGYRTLYGNRYDYCPNCGAQMDGGEDRAVS